MSNAPKPIEVFLSYAPEDKPLCLRLEEHLGLLKREKLITTWHKHLLSPGTDWKQELDSHLNAASLILLLLSTNFLNSEYCGVEMEQAMQRYERGEARVIPIVLRPMGDWRGLPFGNLTALPSDGKSITEWPDPDAAFTDVAEGIKAVLHEIQCLAEKPIGEPLYGLGPAPMQGQGNSLTADKRVSSNGAPSWMLCFSRGA